MHMFFFLSVLEIFNLKTSPCWLHYILISTSFRHHFHSEMYRILARFHTQPIALWRLRHSRSLLGAGILFGRQRRAKVSYVKSTNSVGEKESKNAWKKIWGVRGDVWDFRQSNGNWARLVILGHQQASKSWYKGLLVMNAQPVLLF